MRLRIDRSSYSKLIELFIGMAKRYGISFFCIVITAECQ